MKVVKVVAAAILSRNAHQVFLAKRPDTAHQGGLWEFPGGKLDDNESAAEGLIRELQEELGIVVFDFEPLIKLQHNYGDKLVELDVYCVHGFTGEAHGAEGQETSWVNISDIHQYKFPAANAAIVAKLIKLSQ